MVSRESLVAQDDTPGQRQHSDLCCLASEAARRTGAYWGAPVPGKRRFRKALGPKGMALKCCWAKNGLQTSCWSAGSWWPGSRERKRLLPVYKSSMTLSILFSSVFLFVYFPCKTLWMKAAGWWFPLGHRFLVLLSSLSRECVPCCKMLCVPLTLGHWGGSCDYPCAWEACLHDLAGLYI